MMFPLYRNLQNTYHSPNTVNLKTHINPKCYLTITLKLPYPEGIFPEDLVRVSQNNFH